MLDFKSRVMSESLRYLRVEKNHNDSELTSKINECINELDRLNSFKFLVKTYEKKIINDVLYIDGVAIESKDVMHLLKESKLVYVYACTLGVMVDRLINAKLKISTYEGMIYDSVSSAYVEEKLGDAVHDLHCETSINFTSRFSPGYGDLEITQQRKFDRILDYKVIGLNLSSSDILIPRKSTTGIFGDSLEHYIKEDCSSCKKTDCSYRSE